MDYKFQEYIKQQESKFLNKKVNDKDLIRISDAQSYLNSYKEKYSLTDVGSSLKVDKTHVGFDIITLKGSDGNEYVIDEGKVYREVITTKYVLVDENL